jgi:modulator of FtsH protease HflK
MPWSNQSGGGGKDGGGWKSGGGGSGGGGDNNKPGGPWGQGPWGQGGGNNQQPDLEEILKRGQDKFKQFQQGAGLPGPLLLLLAAIGCALVGFFAFTFQVGADEEGVVLRFGKYVRKEPPGLHFRLPYPIEEVRRPKVLNTMRTEIGLRGASEIRRGTAMPSDVLEESLMLTGDENIVDVGFVVLWNIKSAKDFLFNIQNPEVTVKEVAESAIREVIGKSRVQDVLTEKRREIEVKVMELLQRTLDAYGSGVQVTQLQMQRAEAPSQVMDAFRDVAAAAIDQKRIQNQADGYANKVVPEARGEAERIKNEAQGYKERVIAEAKGQTDRFIKIYDEYKKAPEVTRKRMYLETMERVLGGTDKIILDSKGGGAGGGGAVPFLPLDQLRRPAPAPGAN